MIVSVGGTPTPILFALEKHRPRHVWYFCSAGSRGIADAIQAKLTWHPDRDIIEVARFEELGPCYQALRREIPALLAKWHVREEEVLVDYTGGTKTMSAALVLAATEYFHHFSYVGGGQRDKGGLGVTLDGREKVFYQANPWADLAVREVERARALWAGYLFDAAAQVLHGTAKRVPNRIRFETMAEVADAMAARHRLDFKKASEGFGRASKAIPALYDGQEDWGLLEFVRSGIRLSSSCSGGMATRELLRELLDNCLRSAAQSRFEDAAARLYRAMEMQAQIWLAEATKNAFINGKMQPGTRLPDQLENLDCFRSAEKAEIKLGLDSIFRALACLSHDYAGKIAADIDAGPKSRWHQATEKRNTSILAHGVSSIGKEGFEAMKKLATEFLGFDLGKEANPVPPLDPRWF